MEIAERGGIRTSSDGGAVVQLPNKSKVWLKESTALEIEQRQTLASRLALVFGKIKVRVPHLMRKEKFEVRTPAAICAVRGTEFTMGTTEDGKMDLKVLFGEVKFKFNVPPAKGKAEFNIPQGQGLETRDDGKPSAPALLTAAAEREAMENWNPGLKADERQKGLIEKANDRAQIKDYAKTTASAENAVKNFLNVVKESDLEAGRTLRDVHGNTVRVDQRMMRPAADEIQFFNLVKRPVYNNNNASVAKGGFQYNGAQAVVNRLDYMQMTMAFDKGLPQRIEEWPAFFNDSAINPAWASFVTANRTDAGEIFFVAQGYKYDAARDELVNNPWVIDMDGAAPLPVNDSDDRNVLMSGVLTDNSELTAIEGLNRISRLRVTASGGDPGKLLYKDGALLKNVGYNDGDTNTYAVWAIKTTNAVGYSEPQNAPDNAPLAQFQADMYDVGNGGTDFLWFAKENYVISNAGAVRKATDFTESGSDPFTLLKDNALQSVMYIKKSHFSEGSDTQGLNNVGDINTSAKAKLDIMTDDYFAYKHASSGTNIDVVFIPDLMVAAVQRMLPAITNLKD
jgi:hypothetical protein